MANSLLKHHISTMRLKPDYPYRNMTLHEQLEAWRNECKRKRDGGVRADPDFRISDDCDDLPLVGE